MRTNNPDPQQTLDEVVIRLVALGNPVAAHAAVDRLRELLLRAVFP
ncbi:hypothetical protein [Amycolatopsis echigonensis]|nr:hypothetical protein [Amycolatopsis niigatensis]